MSLNYLVVRLLQILPTFFLIMVVSFFLDAISRSYLVSVSVTTMRARTSNEYGATTRV